MTPPAPPAPRIPDETDIKTLARSTRTVPEVVGVSITRGEDGIAELERGVRELAAEKDGEKLHKHESLYAPQTPIPFGVWEYKCATCRFYVGPDESDDGSPKCQVVGREGDLFGGESVHPEAWCGLWLPNEGQEWFDYVRDRLEGEGEY